MQSISLKMVNDAGTPVAWPGVDASWTLNDNDTVSGVLIGVSSDGNTNQAYPIGTSLATITATYPRVYGGLQIVSGGDTYLFSNSFADYDLRVSHCCGAMIQSNAFALKISNYPLTPGEPVPCGAEAIFMWLAVLAAGVTGLQYRFGIKLESEDGLTVLEGDLVALTNLLATTQLKKAWPTDFIGTVIDGTTLVANNVVAGVNELNVGVFDNGQITVITEIVDTGSPTESEAATAGDYFDQNVFALPATDCGSGGSDSDSMGESESDGVPFGQFRFYFNTSDPMQAVAIDFTNDIPTDALMAIDWGDGSEGPDIPIFTQPETLNHVYVDPGEYFVNWGINDSSGLLYIDLPDSPVPTGIEFLSGSFPLIQSINLTNSPLALFNLSGLTMFEGQLYMANCGLSALDAEALPAGVILMDLQGNNINDLDLPNFPTTLQELNISGNTLSVPLSFAGLNNLVNVNMVGNGCPDVDPATLPVSLRIVDMGNNAFDSDMVDAILARLDANGQINGQLVLNGQNPSGAPPSGAGLASIASLEGKGWTVSVDS